jgi:UDP-glucose 4-epimerase
LSLAYARQTGLAAVMVRLFNTIGSRQTGQYGMVVSPCVRQALRRMIAAMRDESSARADD